MIDSPAGSHRESKLPGAKPPARTPRPRLAALALAGLALALLAYAVLAYGYLRLTPAWQNPDEPAHYNYVAFVAETGGLPELRPGDWDSALLERLKNGALQPGDSISAVRYESWQPPLFYLLAAPVYRLGPTGDPSQVLPRLRALDAVLGAITLVLAYFVAREVFEPGLAVAVPVAMVGVPMFIAVSAALSADPLANLLAVAILLVLLKRPAAADDRWSVLLGALLGLGLLTKLELGIFVPIALGVIALPSARWPRLASDRESDVDAHYERARRAGTVVEGPASPPRAPRDGPIIEGPASSPRAPRDGAIVLVTAGVCVAPWLVHQVTTYGWTDPLALGRHAQVVADQPRFPGFTFDWLGQLLTISFHSFWAQFGWMAIVAPVRLYVVWGVVALAALLGLVVARRRLREPAWLLMLATVLIACVAYLGYNLAFEQFQARYVFTALTPIAALLVLGWSAVVPRRTLPWAVLLLSLALIVLNAYTLTRVLVPGFAPPT